LTDMIYPLPIVNTNIPIIIGVEKNGIIRKK
jgi:hypothetical protein